MTNLSSRTLETSEQTSSDNNNSSYFVKQEDQFGEEGHFYLQQLKYCKEIVEE